MNMNDFYVGFYQPVARYRYILVSTALGAFTIHHFHHYQQIIFKHCIEFDRPKNNQKGCSQSRVKVIFRHYYYLGKY